MCILVKDHVWAGHKTNKNSVSMWSWYLLRKAFDFLFKLICTWRWKKKKIGCRDWKWILNHGYDFKVFSEFFYSAASFLKAFHTLLYINDNSVVDGDGWSADKNTAAEIALLEVVSSAKREKKCIRSRQWFILLNQIHLTRQRVRQTDWGTRQSN